MPARAPSHAHSGPSWELGGGARSLLAGRQQDFELRNWKKHLQSRMAPHTWAQQAALRLTFKCTCTGCSVWATSKAHYSFNSSAPLLQSASLIQEALLHKRAHGNSFGQLTLLGFKQGLWALGFCSQLSSSEQIRYHS